MPFISEDIVRFVPDAANRKPFNLYWGEEIEIVGHARRRTQIKVLERSVQPIPGSVKGRLKTQQTRPLHFMMVDVQQGDGLIMITPQGKKIFIDGGDNKLFARFAANRFRGSSKERPVEVDAMIVTHGDADHFDGLNKIVASERHRTARKRLFLYPKRVFHNGLVKGPSRRGGRRVKDESMFGTTVRRADGSLAITALVDDLLTVDPARMNTPFKRWQRSLKHWSKHGPIDCRRLAQGNRSEFSFLRPEGIEVEVLGPVERSVSVGGKRRRSLDFYRTPPKDDTISVSGFEPGDRAFSASHTINGQSVTLRITYGNVRFFLGGDLNQESMAAMRRKFTSSELQSEILKIPHHGSADFDFGLLKRISPVISLISSGDESSRKEHIHPRATLLGALGRIARNDISLVFSTELAAFFQMRGLSRTVDDGKTYFGFERTNFGIVHIRTDGERVLVFTHSGKEGMNEAYRLQVDAQHRVTMARKVKRR